MIIQKIKISWASARIFFPCLIRVFSNVDDAFTTPTSGKMRRIALWSFLNHWSHPDVPLVFTYKNISHVLATYTKFHQTDWFLFFFLLFFSFIFSWFFYVCWNVCVPHSVQSHTHIHNFICILCAVYSVTSWSPLYKKCTTCTVCNCPLWLLKLRRVNTVHSFVSKKKEKEKEKTINMGDEKIRPTW